ncbi:hypothetical protein N7523_008624 [Penicillium sp. IBT 18751x]|nr:hypothetical protein N7523_008624 [Penicillium sp. IBT 18751x]
MGNFTLVNGQVYTPGLAIVDAPQPNTPLDTLQVAIDVSGDGKLPWPPSTQSADSPTLFHNITLFLTSEAKSHNFTISNGTVPSINNTYLGPVLDLEPSSTVKHVNWVWPECLVGNGDSGSDRGDYNISMHQSFRWNGTDYYTVFDLPIAVTNSIPKSSERVNCALLENKLLSESAIDESSDTLPGQPWVDSGASTSGDSNSSSDGSSSSTSQGTRLSLQKMLVLVAVGTLTLLHW